MDMKGSHGLTLASTGSENKKCITNELRAIFANPPISHTLDLYYTQRQHEGAGHREDPHRSDGKSETLDVW